MKKFSYCLLPLVSYLTAFWSQTYQCGEYQITITETPAQGYLYQARSAKGNIDVAGGSSTATSAGRVFIFPNGDVQYWLVDGTLDSTVAAVLEVYQNQQLILERNCTKIN